MSTERNWSPITNFPLLSANGRENDGPKYSSLMCIRCRGNCFTEPLLRYDRGLHRHANRLLVGIYEVHFWDGLRCYDVRTKFNKEWFRYLVVDNGDSQSRRQHGDLISLLSFIRIRKVEKDSLGRAGCIWRQPFSGMTCLVVDCRYHHPHGRRMA